MMINREVSVDLPILFPPAVEDVDLLETVPVDLNVHGDGSSVTSTSDGYIIAPYSLALCLLSKVPFCRCVCSYLTPCVFVIVICLLLFVSRNYVKYCLMWLDTQEEWMVYLMFVILYTAVSFPFMWGYILLNLACGYHFGLVLGILASVVAACIGVIVAQLLMKNFCFDIIKSKLITTTLLQSILSLLEGGQAFKIVVVSRLTPIPFGLQNAVFAVSRIQLNTYLVASTLGLFPTQFISVYLGTTLRSIEDVLTDDNTAITGYLVMFVQVFLSILLISFLIRQAKLELKKSMSQNLQEVYVTKDLRR
ncbi:transmembrane protein 64 [Centruroides vittatus]|uniref:transmembrane protein 64 n=1 Tax=Centruroides vittatus TaxID=120091 RepID=UPI00351060B1